MLSSEIQLSVQLLAFRNLESENLECLIVLDPVVYGVKSFLGFLEIRRVEATVKLRNLNEYASSTTTENGMIFPNRQATTLTGHSGAIHAVVYSRGTGQYVRCLNPSSYDTNAFVPHRSSPARVTVPFTSTTPPKPPAPFPNQASSKLTLPMATKSSTSQLPTTMPGSPASAATSKSFSGTWLQLEH